MCSFHVFQLDNNTTREPWLAQIEHFYRLNLFNGRMYLAAFADQDVYYDSKKPFVFVTEHQLGLRLVDQFYVVVEYRLNEYLPTQKSDRFL